MDAFFLYAFSNLCFFFRSSLKIDVTHHEFSFPLCIAICADVGCLFFFPSCVFLRESCTILEICVCNAFHALVNSKLFDAIEYLCMCVNVRERAFF